MLREALEYVARTLAPAAKYFVPVGEEEYTYFDRAVHRPPHPTAPPQAAALKVSTLKALTDYLGTNVDGLDLKDYLIHVASPTAVHLVSRLEAFHRRREPILTAECAPAAAQAVDRWMSLDEAILNLMALFQPTGDHAYVLDLLKKVTGEGLEVREDSGYSQQVTVTSGVHLKDRVTVKNPLALAPFRTFAEIEGQPLSLFVLRVQQGPQVLLKTADGHRWKVDAVQAIATYLERNRSGNVPAIIY
jgi:hypothetical protein